MKFLEKKNKTYNFFFFPKKKVRADFNSSLFIISMSIHLFPSYINQIVISQQHYNCLNIKNSLLLGHDKSYMHVKDCPHYQNFHLFPLYTIKVKFFLQRHV